MIMVEFENTKIAFDGKSSKDLRRAYWLFKIVANPNAVKFGKLMTNFALKIHLPINWAIKPTIFRQFCGGESIQESLKTCSTLAEHGIQTILDYSIEGKTKEEDFDTTVREIIATIHEAKNNRNIPFAVFKITGICQFDVLEKTNDSDFNLDENTKQSYEKLKSRVENICNEAHKSSVPIFIDAEESWIQNSIDRIVREMSLNFNKDKAIVFNTIQLYRHDRLAFLKSQIKDAQENNYHLGIKLVRGAYMEKERERAKENGYASPIHATKSASDEDFNQALKLVVDNIENVSFCAGTHNENSSRFLTELLNECHLENNDPRVLFAQLLGMSDHISYNLAHANYNVAKYVPYGPIKEVLPYLIRRAEENTSVAGQTTRELSLIDKERKRRKN